MSCNDPLGSTHHFACDCREEKFRAIEAERDALRAGYLAAMGDAGVDYARARGWAEAWKALARKSRDIIRGLDVEISGAMDERDRALREVEQLDTAREVVEVARRWMDDCRDTDVRIVLREAVAEYDAACAALGTSVDAQKKTGDIEP